MEDEHTPRTPQRAIPLPAGTFIVWRWDHGRTEMGPPPFVIRDPHRMKLGPQPYGAPFKEISRNQNLEFPLPHQREVRLPRRA